MNTAYEKNVVDVKELNALMRFRGGCADEIMETQRLILLPSENKRDLSTYHAHLTTEGDYYYQYGLEMSEAELPRCDFESNGVVCYTLFLKETGEMIGYVGLDSKNEFESNLEFYTFKEYRNKGYCKEAVGRYIDAFFNGELKRISGDRVVARTFFENEASKAVLLALGFKSEGIGFRMVPDENDEYRPGGVLVGYVLEKKENVMVA